MDDLLNAQIIHIDSMNEGRRANFKVLDEFDYSNENFALLGVIIERASGMTYSEYIEKNIFEPLDMKSSFADIQKLTNNKNNAIGYTYKDENSEFIGGIRHENDAMGGVFIGPAGGIYSSTRDLYTYFKAINNHTLVTKKTQKLMHTKYAKRYETKNESAHYGYGFYITQERKTKAIGHGGVYPGVGSSFYYYPKTDYYVIVLSNYGSMAGRVIANHITDLIEPNN